MSRQPTSAASPVLAHDSDPGDSSIYRSTDDGLTFPASTVAGQPGDAWDSLAVAPSDPMRVYLAGFRLPSGQPKQLLLYTSADAGATFSALSPTSFTQTTSSLVYVAGVSPTVHVGRPARHRLPGVYNRRGRRRRCAGGREYAIATRRWLLRCRQHRWRRWQLAADIDTTSRRGARGP